jgi:hypothetical protein
VIPHCEERHSADGWYALQVCTVVHEIHRVRSAPLSVDMYDEQTASALCEMCLALCDMRAVLVEVVCQLDRVQHSAQLPLAKQQVLAMQVHSCGSLLPLPVHSLRCSRLSSTSSMCTK